ncbi:MAG: AAA family ATPase [Actinobacteria bacterium]|nr:AAA family ATPase [Actinomycetota bacterium]
MTPEAAVFGVATGFDNSPVVEADGPTTVTLSSVGPEHVSWGWRSRLPVGKLVVLDGDPAVGKSTLAVCLAAHYSTGDPWPDGADCPPGDVLILSAEDGIADTIRPRLDASGGDASRVHCLTEIRFTDQGKSRTRPVTLADMEAIEQAVRRHAVRLVIVDVLMAYLPGKVDSHRDQDIRTVLSRLSDLAAATGCTILLLRHLNKAPGGNPLYRGGGSIGIVGAARSAFLVAMDPDDETRRILAPTKSNLAAMPEALAFRLEDSEEHGCARVVWEGNSPHSAADLLGRREDEDERTERDEATEWLIDYITDQGGKAQASEAIKAAGNDGIAKTTLHRARKKAGIESTKSGVRGGWTWQIALPRIPQESQDSRSRVLEPSESSESWGTTVEVEETRETGQDDRLTLPEQAASVAAWNGSLPSPDLDAIPNSKGPPPILKGDRG